MTLFVGIYYKVFNYSQQKLMVSQSRYTLASSRLSQRLLLQSCCWRCWGACVVGPVGYRLRATGGRRGRWGGRREARTPLHWGRVQLRIDYGGELPSRIIRPPRTAVSAPPCTVYAYRELDSRSDSTNRSVTGESDTSSRKSLTWSRVISASSLCGLFIALHCRSSGVTLPGRPKLGAVARPRRPARVPRSLQEFQLHSEVA